MSYVILAIAALVLFTLLFAAVNALRIKAAPPAPCATEITQAEMDVAAVKLGDMVRVPCVSRREDEDLTEFYNFHAVLEKSFPLLHQHLEREILNGTLLYRWKGADSSKKPIMLMGHQDVVPASDEGWRVPAYSGTVIDGDLYGRGSMDCKSTMYWSCRPWKSFWRKVLSRPIRLVLVSSRETCGASKPTKLISPVILTTEDTTSVAIIRTNNRSLPTLTPSMRASPSSAERRII